MMPGLDLRALFAAGLFPGVLAGLSLLIPAYYFSKRNGWESEPTEKRPSIKQSFVKALPALFAPVIILGGLRSGLFTPPVAVNLLVTTKVANIRLEQTFGWSMLFMVTMFGSLLVVMLFPGIALWLPEYLGYALD